MERNEEKEQGNSRRSEEARSESNEEESTKKAEGKLRDECLKKHLFGIVILKKNDIADAHFLDVKMK